MPHSLQKGLRLHSDCDAVDWYELAILIEKAPLGKRDPDILERSFRGSYTCCFAELSGRLVGGGRAISDGASNSALFDIVVSRDVQHNGIGRAIVSDLLRRIPDRSVLLVSVPGREEFYIQLGFHKLRTAYLRHIDIGRWIRDGYVETMPDRIDS